MQSAAPHQKLFLDVSTSASGHRWLERPNRRQLGVAEAMVQIHALPEVLARIMAARGVASDDADAFLNPTLRDLLVDPSTLTDMNRACERLRDAMERGERIAIFGDYDVDGAASSALLGRFFRHYGVPHEIYIPDRIFEGYGPNRAAIEELADRGAKLLVTVDCGSTSHEALAHAKVLGLDCLVLDHHQVGTELPDVTALVNPNRQDDLSGQGHLCAAGVVFLTLVALNRMLRHRPLANARTAPFDLMAVLDLVALATVCDVVPLKGVNRAFVLRGMEALQASRSPGLAALARAARLDGPMRPWHFGFLLGPRINAGGRIGEAALGARLLMSEDTAEAEEIAAQLDGLNRERQAMEARMLKEAIDEADAEIGLGDGPAVLVTQRETWHAGVVGLLASRLKDRFNRPAFSIAFDDRGIGTGSGRSVASIDLGAAVRKAVEEGILVKGGGHAMAAGLTIRHDQLGRFRAFLEQECAGNAQHLLQRDVLIDAALSASGATLDLVADVARCGPFGAGQPAPVFAFPNHVLSHAQIVGTSHIRVTLTSSGGASLQGIAFRAADTPLGDFLLASRGERIHAAGTLEADFYRGSHRVQLRLQDAAQPEV